MDKRILLVISAAVLLSSGILLYQKVFAAGNAKTPSYITSINNNATYVGEKNSFHDQTDGATRWKWEFGDGEYSMEKDATHIYSEAGKYKVILTTYGSFGYAKNEQKVITVLPGASDRSAQPATFDILGDANIKTGESHKYECSATASSYTWTVENDGAAHVVSNGRTATFVFKSPGTKTLSLKLTGPDKVLTKNILVAENTPPHTDRPAPQKTQHAHSGQRHGDDDVVMPSAQPLEKVHK